MKMRNISCRILMFVVLVLTFSAGSIAKAEIKTYEGVGFAVVETTMGAAKEKAKIDGVRNIAEQVLVYVESKTNADKSMVSHDEIIVMAESLVKVLDVKYGFEVAGDDSFLIRATVKGEVDTSKIDKFFD